SRRVAAEQSRHEQIREHAHEYVGEKLAIAAVNFQKSGQKLPSIRTHRLTCEVECDGCGKAGRTLTAEDSKNRPRVVMRQQDGTHRHSQPRPYRERAIRMRRAG